MTVKTILVTISVLVLAAGVLGQSEKQIALIRAQVDQINKNAPKYTKTTRTIEGISTEGAEATYFVSGRGLMKINAKIFGETYNTTLELYYQGEDLIFAFQKFNRYTAHIMAMPETKIAYTEEGRYYYSGGRLIRFKVDRSKKAKVEGSDESNASTVYDLSQTLKAAYADTSR